MNFEKFLRTPFLTEHLRWLLLTQRKWSWEQFSVNKIVPQNSEALSQRYSAKNMPEFLFSFPIQKQPLEMFCKKGVLKNFAKFIGKPLWQSLFFNKVAVL